MVSSNNQLAAEAPNYHPCPLCSNGLSMWDEDCEKCGKCGREFDTNGAMIASARCEGDLDGWGRLC